MRTELKNINWTDGESNLDTEYSKLACICCTQAWNNLKKKYLEYSDINIRCEIPDINITFIYPKGNTSNDKIELKSSKHKKMPGSTIKKLDINQTLIYCLRPSKESEPYQLRCSQYHSAMGKTNIDLFQDRTPRPFINFNKMNKVFHDNHYLIKDKDCWIEHYANCAIKRIEKTTKCQKSWQDDMIKIIKNQIIKDYIKNTSLTKFKKDKLNLSKMF